MEPTAEMLAAWRAQVERELAGAPFEKLVTATPEGFAIQPLYTAWAGEPGLPGAAPFVRGGAGVGERAGVCMQVDPAEVRRPGALAEDVEGGADALWLEAGDRAALDAALGGGLGVVVDAGPRSVREVAASVAAHGAAAAQRTTIACDPIALAARGAAPAEALDEALAAMGRAAAEAAARLPGARLAQVSALPFHEAGADAADELALGLAAGVATLRALLDAGLAIAAAAERISVQVAIGRDTFGELCKLRALRLCWHKLLAAAGAPDVAPPAIHAVCSPRTLSRRDPWVNLLRVTTEVFAAVLGGAALVTPLAFDQALGVASARGRRAARNAALVLREESHLGRVVDPAGGAYYLEARTDALAREAWARFGAIERDGGIARALASGAVRARLDAAWAARAAAIAKRKEPIVGVTEFAHPGEVLPEVVPWPVQEAAPGLARHRDGEVFEALRARVEAAPPEVVLAVLGPPAEHRARAGYAAAFFAIAGLVAREVTEPVRADVAVLCGSDERYATDAVARAKALRAAGCRRIALAGRPGALEGALREAGVDAFLFVGCDAPAVLGELLPAPAGGAA